MTASPAPRDHRIMESQAAGAAPTRVWDLPTRIFHWALAVAVLGLIITGLGDIMEVHYVCGYAVLSLLLFRLVWGFIGGRWSRFSAFLYSPATVAAYLRGRARPEHQVGHSPLGALSVFALLALLALQVATGLVSKDGVSASGPLTRFVSNATVRSATHWHAVWGMWIVIGLLCLHVLAILFYVAVKRQLLVRPMISGDKPATAAQLPSSRDDAGSRWLALALFLLCAAFATWIASLRA
jgi:cytochrome b